MSSVLCTQQLTLQMVLYDFLAPSCKGVALLNACFPQCVFCVHVVENKGSVPDPEAGWEDKQFLPIVIYGGYMRMIQKWGCESQCNGKENNQKLDCAAWHLGVNSARELGNPATLFL